MGVGCYIVAGRGSVARHEYVTTGVYRRPIMGEFWDNGNGDIYSGDPGNVDERLIVVRKGGTVTSYAANSDEADIERAYACPSYDI